MCDLSHWGHIQDGYVSGLGVDLGTVGVNSKSVGVNSTERTCSGIHFKLQKFPFLDPVFIKFRQTLAQLSVH